MQLLFRCIVGFLLLKIENETMEEPDPDDKEEKLDELESRMDLIKKESNRTLIQIRLKLELQHQNVILKIV